MSTSPRAARPAPWKISSVYVRRRDGPKRIEQPYRILIDEFLASGAAEDRLKLEQLPGYVTDSSSETARPDLMPRADCTKEYPVHLNGLCYP